MGHNKRKRRDNSSSGSSGISSDFFSQLSSVPLDKCRIDDIRIQQLQPKIQKTSSKTARTNENCVHRASNGEEVQSPGFSCSLSSNLAAEVEKSPRSLGVIMAATSVSNRRKERLKCRALRMASSVASVLKPVGEFHKQAPKTENVKVSVTINRPLHDEPAILFNVKNFNDPMDISDIRDIILYAFQFPPSLAPRYLMVRERSSLQHVVVICAPGISPYNFEATSNSDQNISTSTSLCDKSHSRDPKNFHCPSMFVHDSNQPQCPEHSVRCVGGKIDIPHYISVHEGNPLSPISNIFQYVFPLSCHGTRTSVFHPGFQFSRSSKAMEKFVASRQKQIPKQVNNPKTTAAGNECTKSPQVSQISYTSIMLTKRQMVANEFKLHPVWLNEKEGPNSYPKTQQESTTRDKKASEKKNLAQIDGADGAEISLDDINDDQKDKVILEINCDEKKSNSNIFNVSDGGGCGGGGLRGTNVGVAGDIGVVELPDWVHSNVKSLQKPRSGATKLISIDCEMCVTALGSELTRISILNQEGGLVLDSYVRPKNAILDYVTQYSGIVPEMLEGVQTTLEDIQNKLYELVDENTIICGHSLENDLNCLRFTHPFLIDSAILYQNTRNGNVFKRSLRNLTQYQLKRIIQNSVVDSSSDGTQKTQIGHCSIEDAQACLDLVKHKIVLLNSMHVGETSISECLSLCTPSVKSAWIDFGNSCHSYGTKCTYLLPVENDTQAVEEVTRLANKSGITGGVGESCPELIWVHLHGMNSYLQTAGSRPEFITKSHKETQAELARNVDLIYKAVPSKSLVILVSPWNEYIKEVSTFQSNRNTKSAIEAHANSEALQSAIAKAKVGCAMFAIKN